MRAKNRMGGAVVSGADTLRRELEKNKVELLMLDAADVAAAAQQDPTLRSLLSTFNSMLESVLERTKRFAPYWQPAVFDVKGVAQVIKEFGWGTAVMSTVRGRTYMIFKGYPGKRSVIRGTRYRAANLKLLDMGIGKLGVVASAMKGIRISALIAIPLDVALWLLGDKHTISRLTGTISSDLIKAGIAAAAGYALGAAAAGATAVVAAPVVVAFVVTAGLAIILDELDNSFGITELVVQRMEKLEADAANGIMSTVREIVYRIGAYERGLKNQAVNQAIRSALNR